MMLPDDPNHAMSFVMEENWLYETAEKIMRRKSLPGDGKEIAHEVIRKLAKVPNEKWAGIEKKHGYVYRMMEHVGNDVHRRNEKMEALDDLNEAMLEKSFARLPAARSTPAQSAEDAILIGELRSELSAEEDRLLDLRHIQGFSLVEIAQQLGLSHDAVRARNRRLTEKLRLRAGVVAASNE